jgi:ribonuclease ZC3H12
MPPDDPLGRYGPGLTDFLQKHPQGPKTLPPICPYGKKCTYGNKCKYYHPERGQQPVKLVTEKLVEKARKTIKDVKEKGHLGSGMSGLYQSSFC